MKKQQILNYWNALEADQAVKPYPVEYKHSGSTYTEDSIRLTGSQEFIDSVLSKLKEVIKFENGSTRLQLSYQESKDRECGMPTGAYNCYIQVHERGPQAQMANAIFGR
jgi:hypothetical protein